MLILHLYRLFSDSYIYIKIEFSCSQMQNRIMLSVYMFEA